MFYKLLKKYGSVKLTVMLTALFCLLSLGFTWALMSIFEGAVSKAALFISVAAPMVMAPLPTAMFSDLVLKLARAEKDLHEKNRVLEKALQEVKELSGLLPICASCKKIRDGQGYWSQLETYIEKHSKAQFSHGLCDACLKEMYGSQGWYKKISGD